MATADPYKYQWARFVAREKLDSDFQILNEKLSKPNSTGSTLPPADNLSDLVNRYFDDNNKSNLKAKLVGPNPEVPGKFNVGIVGAGCAGLFTAMLIDFINEKAGLDIRYDILEAGKEERLGGRLYTHKFSNEPHDYYDVGAMRFPKNDIMERTFDLFKHLKLDDKRIPYYFDDYKNVCPSYFNDVRHVGSTKNMPDPFNINKGLPADAQIPEKYINDSSPGDVLSKAIEGFVDELKKDLDDPNKKTGWDKLMKADFMSTRQFLREGAEGKFEPFGFNTIEWIETFDYATGWYNQSLSETVLEALDFVPKNPGTVDDTQWECLEGGTQQIAHAMASKLKQKQPEFDRQVTKIAVDGPKGLLNLTIKHKDTKAAPEVRPYFTVFNSTTLGALQRMDLTEAGILYSTKQAIRSLAYGASCKVGIKFSWAWWLAEPHNINKGGIARTDLPLRVCVYPSYNINDYDPSKPKDQQKSAVLLCSYTWAQDAQRLGSLIHSDSPEHEEELKELLLRNLALLHSTSETYDAVLKEITAAYTTHHAYDWYDDPKMAGAFAYFGPGQFSSMWPEITKQNGWLFLIGEAASAHHAWIVGALESAVRGVFTLLETLHIQNETYQPYIDAMNLLKDKANAPFGPLPKEMPERMKGQGAGEKNDLPGNKDLTFTAAQVMLSFLEAAVEAVEAQGASATKAVAVDVK